MVIEDAIIIKITGARWYVVTSIHSKSTLHLQRPLAVRAINALKVLHGTQYTVGTGADIMCKYSNQCHFNRAMS